MSWAFSLMGPTRKKPRTKPPSVEAPPSEGSPSTPAKPTELATDGQNDATTSVETVSSPLKEPEKSEAGSIKQVSHNLTATGLTSVMLANLDSQVKPKSSWYGTWPRKSIPSTSVARETILADKPTNGTSTADLGRFEPKKTIPPAPRPPSMYLGKSRETLDITMGGTLEEEEEEERQTIPDPKPDPKPEETTPEEDISIEDQLKGTEEATTEVPAERPPEQLPPRPSSSSGWLGGWLSRAPVRPLEPPKAPEVAIVPEQPIPVVEPLDVEEPQPPAALSEDKSAEDVIKITEAPKASSSWFGLWSTAAPSTVDEVPEEGPKEQAPVKTTDDGQQDTVMEDATTPAEPTKKTAPAAGSSWAFWSTETPKKTASSSEQSNEAGQLAVTGEVSQDHPEPAKTATVKENKKGKSTKRGRPVSVEIDEVAQKPIQTEPSSSKATPSSSVIPTKASPPNLLIPSVKSTYKLAESPGILQQIARLLLQSHQEPSKHVFLVKEPPKIKNALAIGIHGLFPAAILRTVIGQPTGTSIRFANHAAAAIRRWTDKNGSTDCEIEKVALEGEGKIGDRADNLWKLLLNWIDHVRKADFILIACHSQGVPVAMMLVAKLIEFGVVTTGRIGVLAMGKSTSWFLRNGLSP